MTRHFRAIMRSLDTYWENPQSIGAALATGDLDPDSREVLARMHPEMRWTTTLGIVFHGKAQCARGVDELLDASQAYSVTLTEVTDLGDDHVLAVVEVGMKGKSSGAAGVGSVFTVVTLREGLIAQSEEYLSRADALAAVGPVE